MPSTKVADAAKLPEPRKQRRSPAEIRERILRGAGDEFKTFGYAGATTLNIARRAEVTEAQLFRYFASKSALFREAIFEPLVRHFDDFDAEHQPSKTPGANIRENSRIYITELQKFLGAHSKMLMSLVVAQTYAPFPTPAVSEIDSLQSYFARGAAMMSRRTPDKAKVDPKLMVRVSFAAVLASILFKDWLFPTGLASEEQISDAIIDFVIDGITVDLEADHKT